MRLGGQMIWLPIEDQSVFYEGDSVSTSNESRASLIIGNAGEVILEENSLIRIEYIEDSQVRIRIERGKIKISSKAELMLQGPGQTQGIRILPETTLVGNVSQLQDIEVEINAGQAEMPGDQGKPVIITPRKKIVIPVQITEAPLRDELAEEPKPITKMPPALEAPTQAEAPQKAITSLRYQEVPTPALNDSQQTYISAYPKLYTLKWQPHPNAKSYVLYLNQGNKVFKISTQVSQTEVLLLPRRTYEWRAYALVESSDRAPATAGTSNIVVIKPPHSTAQIDTYGQQMLIEQVGSRDMKTSQTLQGMTARASFDHQFKENSPWSGLFELAASTYLTNHRSSLAYSLGAKYHINWFDSFYLPQYLEFGIAQRSLFTQRLSSEALQTATLQNTSYYQRISLSYPLSGRPWLVEVELRAYESASSPVEDWFFSPTLYVWKLNPDPRWGIFLGYEVESTVLDRANTFGASSSLYLYKRSQLNLGLRSRFQF